MDAYPATQNYIPQEKLSPPGIVKRLSADELKTPKSPLELMIAQNGDALPKTDSTAKKMDYQSLADQAYNLGSNTSPREVIRLLEPHKDNPDNTNPKFFNNLALAYSAIGQNNDALAMLNRSLTYNSNGGEEHVTHFNIAGVYFRMNDMGKALAALEQSLSLKPDYLQAINAREMVLRKIKGKQH